MKRRQESCWETKSNLEKILILIIAILLCFLLALFVVLLLHYGRLFQNLTEKESTSGTCMTPQCVQAAAHIIDFIDPSIDPCDNFYDFACGTFFEKSVERKETNTFSRLASITANRLEALITEPTIESTGRPLQLERKFYRSCMNTTAIEMDNNDALIDLIVKVGDSPLRLHRLWRKEKFHWLWTMVKCRNFGAPYKHFVSLTASQETVNGTEMILLSISPPRVPQLPSHLRDYYVDLKAKVSSELKAISLEYAKQELYRVLYFEDQIREIIQDQEKNGHKEVLQVEVLQKEYPTIPWVDFLNNITVTSVPFSNNSWISFEARNYLTNLINLLKQTTETTQANYVIWRLVESYANYWNKEQRTRYNSFLINLNRNLPLDGDRKAFCLSKAKDYFPSVAEVAYVRKYVQSEIRDDIKEMLEQIRNQLIIRVKNNDWLDDKSKISAEASLEEIQWLIGASNSVYNDSFEKVVNMEEFDLKSDNVVEMTQILNVRKADNYFRDINKNLTDVMREVLETSPILDVNAFYKKKLNTLVVFAPVLQSIIYNFDHPQYMNYGGLGSMIGREFTHSFTSQGNKEEASKMSWPNKTRQEYADKIDCLLEEYQNYTHQLQESTDDGTVALAEILADFVGPNLAYEAYQKWVQYHPQEENLPGLNYTPDQMFWIMFGVVRCHQPRLEDYNDDTDQGHSSFAVNFSVKNSLDFARDFNCPVNSKMNPEKKCQIL